MKYKKYEKKFEKKYKKHKKEITPQSGIETHKPDETGKLLLMWVTMCYSLRLTKPHEER